jgi:hypothetical protein
MDTPKAGMVGDAEKLLENKWVLYGGIGVLVLGVGYYLYASGAFSGQQAASSPAVDTSAPISYPGVGDAPASSGVSSGTDDGSLADAINAATAAQNSQSQTTLAGISAAYDTAIAADQTTLATTNIAGQVANYAASTNVLDAFLNNTTGGVISLGGSVTPTALGGVDVGLYSANAAKGQQNDYTDILHAIAGVPLPASANLGNGATSTNIIGSNGPTSFSGGGVSFANLPSVNPPVTQSRMSH